MLWDCEAVGPYELTVQAIAVAGMLGRVRVFAKNGSWNDDKVQVEVRRPGRRPSRGMAGKISADGVPRRLAQRTHWGHHYDISPDGWELVADEHCAPSWDTPRQVALRVPVVVSPHRKVALFVHSNLPDDLGIQYQSYGRDSVVAQDDMLRMLPGLGFTGHVPFSRNHGWYRAFRGPCGRMKYAARLLRWSPAAHPRFPPELKEAVMAMLLCNARSGGEGGGGPLASLPKDVVLRILEHCHHDWFAPFGRPVPHASS